MLLRALSDEEPRPVLVHVQRFLTRKMGIPDDQPIPVALDFLGDPTHLQASFDKYTQSTERFQKRLEAAKSQKKDEADSKEIEASEMADEFKSELIGLAGWRFSLGADSLDLTLFSGEKPYATNGKWDEKDATVTWSRSLDPDRALPVVCFALWSTPDFAFQERAFWQSLIGGRRPGTIRDLVPFTKARRNAAVESVRRWSEAGARVGAGR